jgi:hypothetical protein
MYPLVLLKFFFQEEVLLLAEGGMAVNCLRECGA